MKKKLLGIIFFTILLGLVFSTKSFGYFRIDEFEINCTVLENGDMKVEENITYATNETKNGVTRDIELKNENNSKNSATGFELESVKVDGIEYKKTYSAQNGDSGVYEYTKGSNKHSFKVYTPFKRQGKTVTYTYLLKNVVVKYQDTAEIYWNFIGSKWDTDISKVDINITLPEESTKGAIYVYGHGSDNGTYTKTGNYITLNAKSLEAYQALDARILFSNAAVPYSTKNVNKEVLEKYIDEEEGLSNKREEKEILFGLSVNQIALGLSIIIIIGGITIYLIYTKKPKIEKAQYIREIPSGLEPELLQTIYYNKVCDNAFWITFLNLVKLGVYRIEKTVNEVGKETQKITFIKKVDGLEEHQEKLISILNGYMEDNQIDLLTLKTKLKNSSGKGYKDFVSKLEQRKESLFGEEKKVPKTVKAILYISMAILVIFIVMISSTNAQSIEMVPMIGMFLTITTFIYTIVFKSIKMNISTIIFLLVHCGMFQMANIAMLASAGTAILYIPYILLFVLIQIITRIVIYSKEQLQLKEQVAGIRRFIKDYSMLEEKGIEHISIWEDYLILAIALGLNNKTINYFYDHAKEGLNSDFGTSLNNIGTYTVMASSFSTTFNSYQKSYTAHVSRSSHSGSSGGFSGGGSSGGGGRRRRRRKLLLKIVLNKNKRRKKMLNVLFMGTPDFALESLKSLVEANYNIIGVVTNVDKPKGRGMKMLMTPVKEYALEKNINVYQPEKVKNNQEFVNEIKRLNPDVICVVAYGKILPKEILDIPKYGCINVHASILPKYRGAAPIQWAVLNGDKETGISTMYMDIGMDTGDIIEVEKTKIGKEETTGELWDRLSKMGGKLLVQTLKKIEDGTVLRTKQGDDFTMAPMLSKDMAKINWEEKTAEEIHNLVRGLNPIMGAYSFLNEKKIKFWKVKVRDKDYLLNLFPDLEDYLFKLDDVMPGTVLFVDDKNGLFIQANNGIIDVEEIQGENARRMPVNDFIRGNEIMAGEVFE